MQEENGMQQEAANAFCYPQSTNDFLFVHTQTNFYRRNLHDTRTKLPKNTDVDKVGNAS